MVFSFTCSCLHSDSKSTRTSCAAARVDLEYLEYRRFAFHYALIKELDQGSGIAARACRQSSVFST